MRIYAIHAVGGPLIDHPRISPAHHVWFDGKATRDGGKLPIHVPTVAYWSDSRIPLEITRHGKYVPPIFQPPGASWVVSEEVRDVLKSFGPCEFLQIQFVKLIDSPICEKGDFSCYKPGDELRISVNLVALLDDYPDVPELHESIGNYYELLIPVIAKLDDRFEQLTRLQVSLGDGDFEVDTMVSEEMFTKYPMLRGGAYLFREDVYRAIDKYLDKDFFLVTHVDL